MRSEPETACNDDDERDVYPFGMLLYARACVRQGRWLAHPRIVRLGEIRSPVYTRFKLRSGDGIW